jgi:hypothetical protein
VNEKRLGPNPEGDDKAHLDRRKSTQEKCHPSMFELALLWKDSIEALRRVGPTPSSEAVAEIDANVDRRTMEIHNR